MKTSIRITPTDSIANVGTHASRLFHAIRVIRNTHFWEAFDQGVYAALAGQPRNNPFTAPHVTALDWENGFNSGLSKPCLLSTRNAMQSKPLLP